MRRLLPLLLLLPLPLHAAVPDPSEKAWLDALIEASPHRQAATTVQPVGMVDLPPAGPGGSGQAQPAKPGRRVFGYLPYWTQKTAKLPWDSLTQVAWFSGGLTPQATWSTLNGWGGPAADALIATAHKNDVQVVLCVTQFNTDSIHTLIGTPAMRKKAVDAIVAQVVAGGGDGVSIDFEGLAKADRENMNAFADLLATTLHQALPGSDVTLATPAVDWSDAWDEAFLEAHTDGLMVMAYAIHWGGGPPGPQLPMAADKPWTHKTLQWVVDTYYAKGGAQNKHKVIIGLPLYGMTWPSKTDQPGSASLGKATAIFFDAAQTKAAAMGGWVWDKTSESTWLVAKDGANWLQTWCDDPKAFQMRADYLDERDVGGMGLWALGYADDSAKVTQAIAGFVAKGVAPPKPDVDAGPGADAVADVASAEVAAAKDVKPAEDVKPAKEASATEAFVQEAEVAAEVGPDVPLAAVDVVPDASVGASPGTSARSSSCSASPVGDTSLPWVCLLLAALARYARPSRAIGRYIASPKRASSSR